MSILTTTLSFNETDATRILSQVTSTSEFLTIPSSEFKRRHWERELRRVTSYELHAATLAEYYKLNRIPRGLRVHLRPTFFTEDLEYCTNFERIINKCSLDLILLTVERLQKAVSEIKTQVDTTEVQLRDCLNTEEFDKLKETVNGYISEYKKEVEEKKRSKFLRDSEDYLLNRVYKWQESSGRTRMDYKRRPRQDFSTSSGSESGGPREQQPFFRRGQGRRPPGRGAGRAASIGGPNVPGQTPNIQTRSQVRLPP